MESDVELTETQARGLAELAAASDESLRYHGHDWTRTFRLSGTKDERSAKNLRSLMELGLAEGRKPDGAGQTQYSWRITEAGRAWLDAARVAREYDTRQSGDNSWYA